MQATDGLSARSLLAGVLLSSLLVGATCCAADQNLAFAADTPETPLDAGGVATEAGQRLPGKDATGQADSEALESPDAAVDTGPAASEAPEQGHSDVPPVPADFRESVPPPRPALGSRAIGDCGSSLRVPHRFLTVDAVFLQRDNGTNNAVIAEDNGGGTGQATSLFTTRDMRFTVGPGTRIFYGSQEPGRGGWEIGYLGVYGMYGDADANASNLLAVPGPIGQAVPGWDRADTIQPNYTSNLNMVELNAFSSNQSLRGDRWAKAPWQRICHRHDSEWLAGFRWAELDEIASLNVIVAPNEPRTSYRVATTSQFFAPQVGWRGRATWDRWLLEGWVKTALAGTLLQSNAAPLTSSLAPGVAYRDPRKNSTTGVGFIGDIAITGGYRFNETWALRTGYTMIWLTGAALAGNQFDFTDTAASGTQLLGAGTVFLQGATLGLEARW